MRPRRDSVAIPGPDRDPMCTAPTGHRRFGETEVFPAIPETPSAVPKTPSYRSTKPVLANSVRFS